MRFIQNFEDMPKSLRDLAENLKAQGKNVPLAKMVGWEAGPRRQRTKFDTMESMAAFWTKIAVNGPNDCWLTKTRCVNYASMKFDGKLLSAHIISFIMINGWIPLGRTLNRIVCHECDNPRCVNPNHLFLGTYAVNAHDMQSKGRANTPIGAENGNSKLTEELVKKMRLLKLTKGIGSRRLSKMYPFMSRSTLQQMLSGKTWKHVVISL